MIQQPCFELAEDILLNLSSRVFSLIHNKRYSELYLYRIHAYNLLAALECIIFNFTVTEKESHIYTYTSLQASSSKNKREENKITEFVNTKARVQQTRERLSRRIEPVSRGRIFVAALKSTRKERKKSQQRRPSATKKCRDLGFARSFLLVYV